MKSIILLSLFTFVTAQSTLILLPRLKDEAHNTATDITKKIDTFKCVVADMDWLASPNFKTIAKANHDIVIRAKKVVQVLKDPTQERGCVKRDEGKSQCSTTYEPQVVDPITKTELPLAPVHIFFKYDTINHNTSYHFQFTELKSLHVNAKGDAELLPCRQVKRKQQLD